MFKLLLPYSCSCLHVLSDEDTAVILTLAFSACCRVLIDGEPRCIYGEMRFLFASIHDICGGGGDGGAGVGPQMGYCPPGLPLQLHGMPYAAGNVAQAGMHPGMQHGISQTGLGYAQQGMPQIEVSQPGLPQMVYPQPGMPPLVPSPPGAPQLGVAQPGIAPLGVPQPGMPQQEVSQPGMLPVSGSQLGIDLTSASLNFPGVRAAGMAQQVAPAGFPGFAAISNPRIMSGEISSAPVSCIKYSTAALCCIRQHL